MIFHPAADQKGKWHRANTVTDTAKCGRPVVLDRQAGAIHFHKGERRLPILCGLCVRAK